MEVTTWTRGEAVEAAAAAVLSSLFEVSQAVAAGCALRCRERKVRAPQSGMLGNAQTLQAVRASGGEGEE